MKLIQLLETPRDIKIGDHFVLSSATIAIQSGRAVLLPRGTEIEITDVLNRLSPVTFKVIKLGGDYDPNFWDPIDVADEFETSPIKLVRNDFRGTLSDFNRQFLADLIEESLGNVNVGDLFVFTKFRPVRWAGTSLPAALPEGAAVEVVGLSNEWPMATVKVLYLPPDFDPTLWGGAQVDDQFDIGPLILAKMFRGTLQEYNRKFFDDLHDK